MHTIVWCTAYTRGGGGGAHVAKWVCNSIAIGKVLQLGLANKGMIDSYNKAFK